jgi:hypothetical protein
VARNQSKHSDKQCQNRKASHRASFFNFVHADSSWLSRNFAPSKHKLYFIMPSQAFLSSTPSVHAVGSRKASHWPCPR